MAINWEAVSTVINPTVAVGTGLIGRRDAQRSAERDRQTQLDLAQHGIRWRVEDAVAAGLHPLAAIGASPAQYSPGHSVGGDEMRGMGQDIVRAISSTRTAPEREAAKLRLASERLDLEGKSIDNAIKAEQLRQLSGGNPAFPGADNFVPGQGDSGFLVDPQPNKRPHFQPGRHAQEAGWRSDVGYARTDRGLVAVIPQGLSESMEDDMIGKALWHMRNNILPSIVGKKRGMPAKSQLPKGYDSWQQNPLTLEWIPVSLKRNKRYPD